ncbi:MAG: hypothetical protein JW931_00115 [Methanomicrobiaceae archaeon]|nr:hypothetical protein [Methanomicrobiaceae archaeon]
MSRVVRINEDSIEIAMKYGKTVSEGIRTMDKIIRDKSRNNLDIEDIRRVIREEIESIGRY